jgi:hypothetical protein
MNSKLREKGKKEEAKRLREFVDAAWRIDPRVAGHKEEERLQRWAARAHGSCWSYVRTGRLVQDVCLRLPCRVPAASGPAA